MKKTMKLKLKVNSGQYKGSLLEYPEKVRVRPTKSKAKEALFNILNFSNNIEGKVFLDLFSGTGNIGIEALSLKASQVHFVEKDKDCFYIIQSNLEKIGASSNQYRVFHSDMFAYLKKKIQVKFDYVYLDPPYDYYNYKKIFLKLFKWKNLNNILPMFILEHQFPIKDFQGFQNIDSRLYGKTRLSFFR